ncbi:WD repeat-containing protein 44 [Bienertia sinuspersici]
MDLKRTTTLNWDGLDEDDDFFDTTNRISAVVPMDMVAGSYDDDSSDDEDEFEDPRMSFSSSDIGATRPTTKTNVCGPTPPLPPPMSSSNEEYDIWMAAPTSSVEDRRRRLLHGMGLNSSKELFRVRTMAMSKKFSAAAAESEPVPPPHSHSHPHPHPPLPHTSKRDDHEQPHETTTSPHTKGDHSIPDDHDPSTTTTASPSPDDSLIFVRSRSDGDIDPFSMETRRRKQHFMGDVSKQRLTRTLSTFAPFTRLCKMSYNDGNSCTTSGSTSTINDKNHNVGTRENNYTHSHNHNNSNDHHSNTSNIKKSTKNGKKGKSHNQQKSGGGDQLGAFFLIKNLDTGKEFVVKEFAEDGMWNRLSDVQTGKQLTMEEFEKSVGYSPVVKELMRRQNQRRSNSVIEGGGAAIGLERKTSVNAYLSKSFRNSKRRGVSLLKNINKVANSVTGLGGSTPEREPHHATQAQTQTQTQTQSQSQIPTPVEQHKGGKNGASGSSNEWVRVRTQGKPYKELTALRFCQEIQAHQGSIWTIKFNFDGKYLASAGEDKVIHIWEVQECEIASLRPPEESANSTPVHPMFCPSPERDISTLDKKKKGRSASRRGGSSMPDYVQLPDTVFALSNEPVCTFQGHLDDVLDLSWSRSQMYLLSSSMDKTVRLWDLETKACLKLFAHNDYVTCIQFNPVNDAYFISGSLDAKVRIWSVPGRRVVDWTDLHEMVTAACYTPDGQGAAVGSHKGNCRMYNITDGKLNQTIQFDIQNKKKTAPKKITGFEFSSDNPNEVLVTSADSRIRIHDGTEVIQKFRGFRNTSSQIAASFSPDGKYAICASEDSHVYIWKREEPRNGKTKTLIDTRTYEYFQCKDVSVAIPWPGSIKFDPPTIQLHTKKNTKKPPTSATNSPKKEEANKHNKRQHLPPLPNNKKNNNATNKTMNKDNNDNKDPNSNNNRNENQTNTNISKDDDNNNNNNHNTNNSEVNVEGEKAPESPEADPAKISRTDSGMGDSFSSSTGASIRYDDSPSITSNHGSSPSWAPGWSWFDGGNASHGSDTMQARAWGLVIVTAGLGGEIKAYQNIGMPLKVGRQSNLFHA